MSLFIRVLGDSSHLGPTIVLVHGFMGDHRDFLPLAEELASEGYRLVLFDLPGHGASSLAGLGPNFEEACLWIWQQLQAHLKGDVYVVGYSLGGRIALSWKIMFDRDISLLVLESSSFGIQNLEERQQRLLKDQKLLGAVTTGVQSFKSFLDAWYRLPLFAGLGASPYYQEMLARRQTQNPHSLQIALDTFSVGNMRSLWTHLDRLSGGLMYLSGGEDKKYTNFGQNLPQSWLHKVVCQASHNIHGQCPKLFSQQLREFLKLLQN